MIVGSKSSDSKPVDVPKKLQTSKPIKEKEYKNSRWSKSKKSKPKSPEKTSFDSPKVVHDEVPDQPPYASGINPQPPPSRATDVTRHEHAHRKRKRKKARPEIPPDQDHDITTDNNDRPPPRAAKRSKKQKKNKQRKATAAVSEDPKAVHEASTCPTRLTHEPSPSADHARAGHPIAKITPDDSDSKKSKPTAQNTQTTDDRHTAGPTAAKRRKRRRRQKTDESSENEPPKRSKNKEKEDDSRASLTTDVPNSSTSESRRHSPKPSEDALAKPPSVNPAADNISETPEPTSAIGESTRSSNEDVQVCDSMSFLLFIIYFISIL